MGARTMLSGSRMLSGVLTKPLRLTVGCEKAIKVISTAGISFVFSTVRRSSKNDLGGLSYVIVAACKNQVTNARL